MNDDQLEASLKNLKSSSREPDAIDTCLEERMMELNTMVKKKRLRTKKLAAIMAVFLIFGTGFIALGGDTAVMNYIVPSSELDIEGNPIPYDFSVGKWLHQLHDHLWDHFHESHPNDE